MIGASEKLLWDQRASVGVMVQSLFSSWLIRTFEGYGSIYYINTLALYQRHESIFTSPQWIATNMATSVTPSSLSSLGPIEGRPDLERNHHDDTNNTPALFSMKNTFSADV